VYYYFARWQEDGESQGAGPGPPGRRARAAVLRRL